MSPKINPIGIEIIVDVFDLDNIKEVRMPQNEAPLKDIISEDNPKLFIFSYVFLVLMLINLLLVINIINKTLKG